MKDLIEKINSASKGLKVYAVGGFVRDLLARLKHTDVDLAVNKNALAFCKRLAKILNAHLITLDAKTHTYRLVLKEKEADIKNIDVSLFSAKTIEKDLANRDFTVNAFAFDLQYFDDFKKHILCGCKDSLKDLKNKTLNIVSPNSFKVDPLRMLRAFRFCAELNFKLSKNTISQIKKNAPLIKKAAPERIKAELFRILNCPNGAEIILQMDAVKLLESIFGEIAIMKKAKKNFYYHKNGLIEHSFDVLCAVEEILNHLKKYFPKSFTEIEKDLNQNADFSEYVTKTSLMKFAAMFHDNAKPQTAKKEGAKVHFFGHDELGAQKSQEIMKNLNMGKKDIAFVQKLIADHMRPSNLTKSGNVTQRAALKFFREIGELTPYQIILSMGDWKSYEKLRCNPQAGPKNQYSVAQKMIEDYFIVKNYKPPKKIINGNIIMKTFKLKPGPWVGDLLALAADRQAQKKLKDTKEALNYLKTKLTAIYKKYKLKS